MDPITQQAVLATAGAAGGDKIYVDDVFSTYLYDGTDSAQSINNGLDLAGEGGMVWFKGRDGTYRHQIFDTERGNNKYLFPHLNDSESTIGNASAGVTSFNNNGFSLGTSNYHENPNGAELCSWSFRKAPGFFDVVTYTGNGTNQTISHNLGSVPGMIIVKAISGTSAGSYMWTVYHRGLSSPETSYFYLNSSAIGGTGYNGYWNGTAPTSTHFSVGSDTYTNAASHNYVAYVFAHDEQSFGTDSNESIIKCEAATVASSTWQEFNLGFEPQWLMIKTFNFTLDWLIFDNMRGVATGGADATLRPNLHNAEFDSDYVEFTPTGFRINTGSFGQGRTVIYMAIRRPNKPPEVGTDVFDDVLYTGTYSGKLSTSLNHTDLLILKQRAGNYHAWFDRLRGDRKLLYSSSDEPEYTYVDQAGINLDENNGISFNTNWYGVVNGSTTNNVAYNFKRAPGFFDMVAYTGTGGNNAVNHNLGVTPEFVIIKDRNRTTANTRDWLCWHKDLTSTDPYIWLNQSSAEGPYGATWITPSSTALNLSYANYVNVSSNNYITYLFATLSGISKVGSYTGTGNAINVDCGFAAGARFILIKRTNSTGDWYVWDTARGIVSGNDEYGLLNANGANVTNTDYIDPLTSGFTVTSSAPDALNVTGGTYIFLAIA